MQHGSMPERGTIDAIFIQRRMQVEYHAKGKQFYMSFEDLEKAFDRVARKVLEWAMRKKRIPEVLVRSMMSQNDGTQTRVRVDSELSEEFEAKVGMLQGSVLSPFLFAVAVDVVTEFAREGALSELLSADDIVLMSETIEGLRNKFVKLKEVFESKGLKLNLRKTKVIVSSGITKNSMLKSKVDTCGFRSLRAKANSALCLQCGKWIQGRCAGVKMVTPKFSRNFTCRKCEGNIGGSGAGRNAMRRGNLKEFTYLCHRELTGG